MFRATSATDRPPSMTKLTASSLYSSVKLRRVEPISETPDEPGSYPRCPPKRERSNHGHDSRGPQPPTAPRPPRQRDHRAKRHTQSRHTSCIQGVSAERNG